MLCAGDRSMSSKSKWIMSIERRLEQWYRDHRAQKGDQTEDCLTWPDPGANEDINLVKFEQRVARATQWQQGYTPFCCSCIANFEAWPTEARRIHLPSIYSLASMVEAAERGCKSCSFWLSRLKSTERLALLYVLDNKLTALKDQLLLSLCVKVSNTPPDSDSEGRSWPCVRLRLLNPGVYIKGTEVEFQVRSVEAAKQDYVIQHDTLSIAKQWLADCCSSHTKCRTGRVFKRPSRILSIAGTTLQVQATSHFTVMPSFATLSYTWGCNDFLKLTEETLPTFSTSIEIDALPKIFAEAIEVARALAIDYIWIDALCIIQGCETDWIRESALMRDIYGGAILNIAANSSRNVHEGGLKALQSTRHQFTAQVKSKELVMVKPINSFDAYGCLRLRAWTLQERLLATRNLCMGDRGVHWHCQCLYARQDDPNGTTNPDDLPDEMKPQGRWSWDAIAVQYSHASLTFGRDRLPALAGIARRHAEDTGDTYIVGMWKRTIVHELCWWPLRSSPVSQEWRAPSWSWLSIDRPAMVNATTNLDRSHYLRDQYASLVDVDIKLTGEDVFGPIKNAKLSLAYTGLLSGQCISCKRTSHGLRLEAEVILNEIEGSITVYLDWDQDIQGQVYLLPLQSLFVGPVEGVALLPSEEQQDCYRRIGYFKSSKLFEDGSDLLGEILVSWLESHRSNTAPQTTITLV